MHRSDTRRFAAVYKGVKLVGRTTSGGYGWHTEKSLVPGLVDTGLHETGAGLKVEIPGELFKATVVEESPYDPQNEK